MSVTTIHSVRHKTFSERVNVKHRAEGDKIGSAPFFTFSEGFADIFAACGYTWIPPGLLWIAGVVSRHFPDSLADHRVAFMWRRF